MFNDVLLPRQEHGADWAVWHKCTLYNEIVNPKDSLDEFDSGAFVDIALL